ncbi:hypothetical protein HZC30_08220 [Candidatus Woesearchaeota archaeon]|nr:hypothetical protein [Candidatus Woesearchaeota archaeon]
MEIYAELEKLIATLENTNPKEWTIPEAGASNKYSTMVGGCTYVLSREKPEQRVFKAISPDTLEVENIDVSLPSTYHVEVKKGDAISQNFEVKPFISGSEETYQKVDALFKNLERGN